MLRTVSFPACVALGLAALAAAFIATAASAALSAAEAKKFFNDKGCNGCHGLEEQRLGPFHHLDLGHVERTLAIQAA